LAFCIDGQGLLTSAKNV